MRQFLKGCLLGEGGFSGMSHVPLKIIAAPKYPQRPPYEIDSPLL